VTPGAEGKAEFSTQESTEKEERTELFYFWSLLKQGSWKAKIFAAGFSVLLIFQQLKRVILIKCQFFKIILGKKAKWNWNANHALEPNKEKNDHF
jgi:hypothetical protein